MKELTLPEYAHVRAKAAIDAAILKLKANPIGPPFILDISPIIFEECSGVVLLLARAGYTVTETQDGFTVSCGDPEPEIEVQPQPKSSPFVRNKKSVFGKPSYPTPISPFATGKTHKPGGALGGGSRGGSGSGFSWGSKSNNEADLLLGNDATMKG